MSIRNHLLVVSLAACAAACHVGPITKGPVETGAGSLAQGRQYLEGRWSLQSFEVFPRGAAPIKLAGNGTLLYDEHGNLDMEIRTDEATAQVLHRAGIETSNGVLSNKGRAVVDMQKHTLTFVMDGQPPLGAPSGPLALNRQRHWQVAGNVLTLTTNGDDGRPVSVGRWKKDSPTP
jgi:hypothetical protein